MLRKDEKMKPLISVIIPTYNRAILLERAIISAISQTYKNIEIIVIDDGSRDGTKRVISDLKKRCPDIRYFYEKNSGGPSKPRNKGIIESKGQYIAFLDDDDEWLPRKLEEQMNLFFRSNSSKLGFVGCYGYVISKNKKRIEKTKTSNSFFKDMLRKNRILTPTSILVKREVFNKVGVFDEKLRLWEDWEMWIRISKEYKFGILKEVLYKYCQHPQTLSKEIISKSESAKYLKYILEKHYLLYKKDRIALSQILELIGRISVFDDNPKRARKYLVDSIKQDPFNAKAYFYLISSFLGTKAYRRLNKIKNNLKYIRYSTK